MPAIPIYKLGEPLPRVEKSSEETILYNIDLQSTLEKNEIVTYIQKVTTSLTDVVVRSRRGVSLEVKVLPSTLGASAYMDYPITILFGTNLGNQKSTRFNLRVYK